MTAVQVALCSRDQLGEAPFWDGERGELLRVDISRGLVHGWSPDDGASWCRAVDGEVSAAIPRATGDGLLLASGHRLVLDDGSGERVLAVEEHLATNRFNDCKCDPRGRLWAGTMSKERSPGSPRSPCRAGRRIRRVIEGTTISNGLAWSPCGDRMYFIDSTTQRIDVFQFDAATGTVAERRPFATIDPADGLPDWHDGRRGRWCLAAPVRRRGRARYGEDGKLEAHIGVPVTNPTSAVFGGPDWTTMYITSARHRLSKQQLVAEPLAGAVLALEPGVSGLPSGVFAG